MSRDSDSDSDSDHQKFQQQNDLSQIPSGQAIPYDKYIHFIDYYLCNILHNPIYSSTIIILCNYYQLVNPTNTSTHQDNFFDLLSNVINLTFILRFQFAWFVDQNRHYYTAVLSEFLFFIIQNISCIYVLLNFYKIYPKSVQILVILQFLLPYVILTISFINKHGLYSALYECNNNSLPFLICNSFLFINYYDFDQASKLIGLLYKLASLSFKFYLIYQYILCELKSINYQQIVGCVVDNCQFYIDDDRESQECKDNEKIGEGCELAFGASSRVQRCVKFTKLKNTLMCFVCLYMISVDTVSIMIPMN